MPIVINKVDQYIAGFNKILDLLIGRNYPYLWLTALEESIPETNHRVKDLQIIRLLCRYILFSAERNEDLKLNEDIITKILKQLVDILQCQANAGFVYRQANLVTLKGTVSELVDFTEVSRNIDELVILLREAIDDSSAAIGRCKYPTETAEHDRYMSQFD